MRSKKLMILGAGECQVPLMQLSQRMGFEVVAVSIGGDYPGFSVADKAYEIDVRDKEAILAAAGREGICGIVTDQTDISVPSVAYVAERLGLPGIGYDCACRFTNKYLMRQSCREFGVPVPGFCSARSLEEARAKAKGLSFPIIIKPVDSQGSRGVVEVRDLAGLDAVFDEVRSFSAEGTVILEEFFEGTEIVVQGFISGGRMTNLVMGDRVYFDIPGVFIPKQTLFPSLLPEDLKRKVLEINTLLVTNMKPRFGITHSEYLVNTRTGEVRLVETAIRGGGVFISSDLIPLACGIDVNEMVVRLATGDDGVALDPAKMVNRASGYVCFTLPEGTVRKVEGAERLKTLKGVHRAHLDDLFVGKKTGRLSDKTMRMGPILITGADRGELDTTIREIRETLQVEVETRSGIYPIVW